MASGTPFAQFRIPVGDLVFCSKKNVLTRGENLSGGVKIMRRQNNYPAAEKFSGAGGPKIRKNLTVPKIVAQCRKYLIPYLIFLQDILYPKPKAITYLNA